MAQNIIPRTTPHPDLQPYAWLTWRDAGLGKPVRTHVSLWHGISHGHSPFATARKVVAIRYGLAEQDVAVADVSYDWRCQRCGTFGTDEHVPGSADCEALRCERIASRSS